jgi:hypothetical protein
MKMFMARWSPIGAEQIAGGDYLVAWKEAGANLYSVWTTDSTGHRDLEPQLCDGI